MLPILFLLKYQHVSQYVQIDMSASNLFIAASCGNWNLSRL